MKATNLTCPAVVCKDNGSRTCKQPAHRLHCTSPMGTLRRHLSLFLLPGYLDALPSVSDGGLREPYPHLSCRGIPDTNPETCVGPCSRRPSF